MHELFRLDDTETLFRKVAPALAINTASSISIIFLILAESILAIQAKWPAPLSSRMDGKPLPLFDWLHIKASALLQGVWEATISGTLPIFTTLIALPISLLSAYALSACYRRVCRTFYTAVGVSTFSLVPFLVISFPTLLIAYPKFIPPVIFIIIIGLWGLVSARGFWAASMVRDRERVLISHPDAGNRYLVRLPANLAGWPRVSGWNSKRISVAIFMSLAGLFYAFVADFPALAHLPIWAADNWLLEPSHSPPTSPESESEFKALDLAVALVALILAFALARTFSELAKRQAIETAKKLMESDTRRPLLFLRAFRDDTVKLKPYSFAHRFFGGSQYFRSMDELITHQGAEYGPVIALGNPADKSPPYGASRAYLEGVDWQKIVTEFAKESFVIIMCLDDTESVAWEIDLLFHAGHFKKTLFVVPPSLRARRQNMVATTLMRAGVQVSDITNASDRKDVIGFWIDSDDRVMVALSSSFSQEAYLLLFRWFVRCRGS